MTGLEGVNKKGLRKIYKENAAAAAVLDHLAGRERDWGSTTADRLLANVAAEGSEISRGQLVEVLKALEDLGCGQFIVGRRGHPSRFQWLVSLVSVGQYAAAEREDIEKLSEDAGDEGDAGDLMKKHPYNLRRDLTVELVLPADLSASEATRLAKFIETLPFA
ncbi:MAG: hypothetical protein WDO74_04970 [Pseudomonadota bacterium]